MGKGKSWCGESVDGKGRPEKQRISNIQYSISNHEVRKNMRRNGGNRCTLTLPSPSRERGEEEETKEEANGLRGVTRPKRPGLNPGKAGAKPAEAGW
jgi:hypothetical protein